MFEPLMTRLSTWYRARVGKELRKYGLRLEDLYDPMASAVKTCDVTLLMTDCLVDAGRR